MNPGDYPRQAAALGDASQRRTYDFLINGVALSAIILEKRVANYDSFSVRRGGRR